MKRIAFLDTNTFLHYEPLTHIDWLSLLDCEYVVLTITPIVIREMNRHKDSASSTRRTRQRAADRLKQLDEWLSKSPAYVRDRVEVRFRAQEPLLDFTREGLLREMGDDQLIASVLEHSRQEGYECFLVTEDIGLKLKALAHGLKIFKLPSTLRLKDEPDAQEKRLAELEAENKRLRDRVPTLRLAFGSGERVLRATVKPPNKITDGSIEEQIQKLREAHPKLTEWDDAPFKRMQEGDELTSAVAKFTLLTSIPNDEIRSYNAALDEYFAATRNYLQMGMDTRNLASRTIRLNLLLENDGSTPAENPRVHLHFPDGFVLVEESDRKKLSQAPTPPDKPQTKIQRGLDPNLFTVGSLYPRNLPTGTKFGTPTIRKTRSYDVDFELENLSHGYTRHLKPLFVVFVDHNRASSFSFEYQISADNLPKFAEGELSVVIDKLSS